MKFKGVVFDFNGTLLWDTKYHNQAFDLFLEQHNIVLTDEEKSVKIYGKSNADIMRDVFGRPLTDLEIKEFSIEKELIYQELIVDNLHFAEGAEDLFEYLKAHNIPFCIATSSDFLNVEFYFREMQLERWFSPEWVLFNDGTLKGKPEPDLFLKAADRLQLNTSELVIFEDSKAGIKAAENAGAGKIYIVNSMNDDFSDFEHEVIFNFNQTDKSLFGM
ncbi:MAG: HAD family phosphatase [Paludibacter sp.]|nr:HAD family phosphatase [Paludibacter sp.]